jgi:hypothetical protein
MPELNKNFIMQEYGKDACKANRMFFGYSPNILFSVPFWYKLWQKGTIIFIYLFLLNICPILRSNLFHKGTVLFSARFCFAAFGAIIKKYLSLLLKC